MTPNVKLTITERNGRKYATTGSPWEPVVGYSRAVRTGDFVFVTGTVGLEPDGRFGATVKSQTRRALEIIVAAIEALGGKPADIVRTRIYGPTSSTGARSERFIMSSSNRSGPRRRWSRSPA